MFENLEVVEEVRDDKTTWGVRQEKGTMICPVCVSPLSHIREVFTEYGDSEGRVYPGTIRKGESGNRRSSLVVRVDGECGHSWDLRFSQHKGQTYLSETMIEPAPFSGV